MGRLAVLLLGLICGRGTYNFDISSDLAPEQVMLFKRSADFLNAAFGCDIVGVTVNSTLKNVYAPQDSRSTIVVLKNVSLEPGVSPDALAFTDDRFSSPHQGFGVHIAINDSRSHPSTAFVFKSDSQGWSPSDWNLVRIVVHEFGHALRLRDDEANAGPIMVSEERDSDQEPITSEEISAFVGAIRDRGISCQPK